MKFDRELIRRERRDGGEARGNEEREKRSREGIDREKEKETKRNEMTI